MSALAEADQPSLRTAAVPAADRASLSKSTGEPPADRHRGRTSVLHRSPEGIDDRVAPGRFAATRQPWVRRVLRRAIEPHILFPAITILFLVVIWSTAFTLLRIERDASRAAAIVATRELVETYEAQVARSVREIDQTLKYVKHACQAEHCFQVLERLKSEGLLPPDLIFAVAIADAKGNIVDTTRPVKTRNIADRDYFRAARDSKELIVGQPRRPSPADEWRLRFVRRLDAPDGRFAGVVMVAVDSAYFVSGYEPVRMGNAGALGLLGSDGVFRARRVGDVLSAGDSADYAAITAHADAAEPTIELQANSWDGVRRFTAVRELFNQKLAVIVGLSEDEQLGPARSRCRSYLWFAAAVSVLIAGALGTMGRLSWNLAIDRRRAAQEKASHAARIEFLAYHDPLTKLPNRRHFALLLHQAIEHAKRRDERICVLFIDLDGFKRINDTLGHDAGDQLLQSVAARTRACLRDSDTVSRLGGDEFVVLLPHVPEDAHVAELARAILAALAVPLRLRGAQSSITASIGISRFPADGLDADALTKSADGAMYAAKKSGKNRFCFHGDSESRPGS